MRNFRLIVLFCCVLTFEHIAARQHYNQNTDFLLHEAGARNDNPPKRDYVAPFTTKNSDFPPLGPQSSSVTTPQPSSTQQVYRPTQPTGKRDYVAANFPPLNPPTNTHTTKNTNSPSLGPSYSTSTTAHPQPTRHTQSSGKRDYVSPNFPPLNPPTNSHTTKNTNFPSLGPSHSTASPQPTRPAQSSGKRDYVAPNFPSTGTSQQGSGKVKDLINFYDSKDKQPSAPQKVPSYSSILQGPTTNGQTVTQSTSKVIPSQTPKPLSFSDIVAGPNRPTSITTNKPATRETARPGNVNKVSTTRPLVPPSSIANGNQGNNGNNPSDSELQTLSEELLRRDTNNAAQYITINYQEKTTSSSTEDRAALPLLTISADAWNIPTIQKLLPLLDNYERDTLVNEHVTPQERNEENAFMDAIMSTSVIRHLMNFLKDKGYVTLDPKQQRDFLKQMWFGLYSRGKGKLSSSGFEHIFVSELKNNQVSGLHNWVYFSREEQANRLNYLGYLKYTELGDKGAVIKFHINQQGVDKPVDAIFIGTSPELEMALYTLCFVTRVDDDCNLKLAGKDVNVATYKFRYRSKNYIGSGFPQI